MKITDFFDKIYCINLERRPDRWEECLTEFNKFELTNVNRFIAIDGKELPDVKSDIVNPSVLALVLTNIQIFEEAISNNYNSILILEDDIELNKTCINMEEYFKMLPEDWDMIYFGGNHNTHFGANPPVIVNEKVCKLHNTYSTHCVGINKKSFTSIYDRLKKCDNALDVIYSELQNILNVYSFYPMIATQRVSFSDIENKLADYKSLIK
jgi:glycosyl transferase family 25